MGMSTHVTGFGVPDQEWERMHAVWTACMNADVEIPDDVLKYFMDNDPDLAGLEIKIPKHRWHSDDQDGY